VENFSLPSNIGGDIPLNLQGKFPGNPKCGEPFPAFKE
jgi:hypothetical protein